MYLKNTCFVILKSEAPTFETFLITLYFVDVLPLMSFAFKKGINSNELVNTFRISIQYFLFIVLRDSLQCYFIHRRHSQHT